MLCWNTFERKKSREGESMELRIGDSWYGKQGTAYEGIQATIDDVTARYVQVSFTPALDLNGSPVYGKPLGKRHFVQHFAPQPPHYQLTIFDV